MSIISVIGIMLAMLAGIVLLCLAVTRLEKTAKSSEYDERQQLVRGRAHRLTNMVGFVYMLIILPELIGQVEGVKHVEAHLLVFAGFILLTMVFHVYCFINHAALPLASKSLALIPCYLVVGLMWIVPLRSSLRWAELSLVGYGTTGIFDLMMSFYWLTLAALHIIEIFRREKE